MIVTYHQLERESSGDLYKVTCSQIEEHFQLFRQLHDIELSFDDGHFSNFEYGVPLLQKYGFRALFFVPASWVEKREGTMSWSQLRELISMGHHVQSHSASHAALTHCSDAQLQQELEGSRLLLEDKLGVRVDCISAPYGRWDRRVLRACRGSGYSHVFTSDPWLSRGIREGIEVIGRLTVRRTMSTPHIRELLTARGWNRMLLQSPFILKQALRKSIGDRMYHKLWCWFANRHEPAGYGFQ